MIPTPTRDLSSHPKWDYVHSITGRATVFYSLKNFRFMWAFIMGPKGQAPTSLYLGPQSTLHKVKTQSTISQVVILLCGYNIIKQCAFVHVGPKNIIMGCRNQCIFKLNMHQMWHLMIIFSWFYVNEHMQSKYALVVASHGYILMVLHEQTHITKYCYGQCDSEQHQRLQINQEISFQINLPQVYGNTFLFNPVYIDNIDLKYN